METAQIFLCMPLVIEFTPTPVQVSTNTPMRKCAFKSWDNAPITDSDATDRQVPPKIMARMSLPVSMPFKKLTNHHRSQSTSTAATNGSGTLPAAGSHDPRCVVAVLADCTKMRSRFFFDVYSRGRGLSDRFGNV
jgi:hypothetical protein